MVDRHISFDGNSNGLRKWLKDFGEEVDNWDLLHDVNGHDTKDEVFDRIDTEIKEILAMKQRWEDTTKAKIREEEAERVRLETEE